MQEILIWYMCLSTQDNVEDIFTKALPREKFEAFRKALGLWGLMCHSLYVFTSFALGGFVTHISSSSSFNLNLFPIHGLFLL